MKGKKMAVTLLSGLLLVLLYGIIFSFSAQDGEASTNISMGVSGFGVSILDKLTGGRLTTEELAQLAAWIEHPIRKAAHFLEYALMATLVFAMLYYHIIKNKVRNIVVFVWVLLSAVADEVHQYFVPGRWCSIKDVLLDTCGGLAGILICGWIVGRLKKNRYKQKRHRKKAT